jgi:hypothetical protein
VVTASTTILAFKWPSALTAELVVSIRRIDEPAPHGLGGARVPLAESKHKRTFRGNPRKLYFFISAHGVRNWVVY